MQLKYLFHTPGSKYVESFNVLPPNKLLIITVFKQSKIVFQLRTDKEVQQFIDTPSLFTLYQQKIENELCKDQSTSVSY